MLTYCLVIDFTYFHLKDFRISYQWIGMRSEKGEDCWFKVQKYFVSSCLEEYDPM